MSQHIASDGIHDIGVESGRFTRTYDFDYSEIDRNLGFEPEAEAGVAMPDVAACFSLILEWILKADTLQTAGARAASLAVYLNPVDNAKFGSNLAEIADNAGCTRALLSRALLSLRDQAGIYLSGGKRSFARDSYRKAQLAAVEAGVHSSASRKDRKTRKADEQISLEAVAD